MAKSHKKSSGKKAKKTSEWIKHCKAWGKTHNMNYTEVLKDPKCSAAYHAAKKSPSKAKSKKSKTSRK